MAAWRNWHCAFVKLRRQTALCCLSAFCFNEAILQWGKVLKRTEGAPVDNAEAMFSKAGGNLLPGIVECAGSDTRLWSSYSASLQTLLGSVTLICVFVGTRRKVTGCRGTQT